MNPHRDEPPPGSFQRSAYHLPPGPMSRVLLSMLVGRRRNALADASRFLAPPCPPPRAIGMENVPAQGPSLMVMNHYARPGLDAWWPAIVATWGLGQARPGAAIHWLMVSEWAWPTWQYRYIITPVTRWAFGRLARLYDLILTPPVLNHDYSSAQGAAAVRRFLALARETASRGHLLAMAPEGREGPLGALTSLPPGAGRFLLLLARGGLPFLPAGVSEDPPGHLVVRFGPIFHLAQPPQAGKPGADDWAAGQVMGRLAALLPPRLWGEYRPFQDGQTG
jgi:1-acyl-sn-glycerol-3-phosphate acyltransferase